jgi:hypothetical protein
MSYTDGALQQDVNGARAIGAYSPGLGTVSAQAGAVSNDGSGNYAPLVTQSRISDANGNAFGSVSNPIATNQLVGTPVVASTTLPAATGGTATLAAAAGKTTYINGFYVSIAHTASGTVAGQVTVTGIGTTLNFLIAVSATYPGLVEVNFPDPIPASAVNTAIVVTAPTLTGAGIGSVTAFGYQL